MSGYDWDLYDPDSNKDQKKKEQEEKSFSTLPKPSDFQIPSMVRDAEKIAAETPTAEIMADADKEEDEGGFFSAFGGHLLSSATLGGSELFEATRTEDWRDKNVSELWGAALGEAAGFLVPVGLLGKGLKGAVSLANIGLKSGTRYGSKALAKQAAKEASELAGTNIVKSSVKQGTNSVSKNAVEDVVAETLLKESGAKWWQLGGNKVGNLYKYEIGGESLLAAERNLGERAVVALGSGFKDMGIDVSQKQVDDIVKGYLTGLREGKHYNTAAAWLGQYAAAAPAGSFLRAKVGKWFAQGVDEALVLSMDGVLRDAMRTQWEEGYKADPASAIGHSAMLGFLFPAIRSGFGLAPLKGGGRGKLMDGALVAKHFFSKWKNIDYSKKALTIQGRAEMKGWLQILNGNKSITAFTNKELLIDGEKMLLDQVLAKDLLSEKGGQIALQTLKQLRAGVSTPKALGQWSVDYGMDLVKSLPRMALGGYAMNMQPIHDYINGYGNMEELMPHLMVGAMLTKSRKGWMEGEMATNHVKDYFKAVRALDIDPKGLGNLVNYHKSLQAISMDSRGMIGSETSAEIHSIFDKPISKNAAGEGSTMPKPIRSEYLEVADWYDVYYRYGVLFDGKGEFSPLPTEFMSESQIKSVHEQLKNTSYKGRSLLEFTPDEFMNHERIGASKGVEKSFIRWIKDLSELGVIEAYENEDGTIDVSRPSRKGKGEEFTKLDRMLMKLEAQTGIVRIRSHKELTESPITDEQLASSRERFQDGINSEAVGPNADRTWAIEDNLFIEEMNRTRLIETEEILHSSATGSQEGFKNDTQRNFKKDVADQYFTDPADGRMAHSSRIKVGEKLESSKKKKKTEEETQSERAEREQLEYELREISSIFYEGTSEKSTSNKEVEISHENAGKIIEQFHSMKLPYPREKLISDASLSSKYGIADNIRRRRFAKQFPDKHKVDMAMDLEGSGLGWWNSEAQQFFVYEYEVAMQKAKEPTSPEQKKKYQEILKYMGDTVTTTGRKVRSDEAPTDVWSIDRLHSKIPEIRAAEITGKITKIIKQMYDKDISVKQDVSILETALGEGDHAKAIESIKSMMKKFPSLEKDLQPHLDAIVEGVKRGETLEAIVQTTLGPGIEMKTWTAAMEKTYLDESTRREQSLTLLKTMLNDRDNSLFYVRNLTTAIEKAMNEKGKSLEELSEDYLNTHSFEDFKALINGAYFSRPKGLPRNDQFYEAEQFRNDIRNDTGSHKRSVQEIITEYGWKDPVTQDITNDVLQKLQTPEGVQELFLEISSRSESDARSFLENDLNALTQAYHLQSKITRATFKDGKLEFDMEVASSRTRDMEVMEWLHDSEGIQIYEISGQALDKGSKPLEIVNDIEAKIRDAEIRIDTKKEVQRHIKEEFDEVGSTVNADNLRTLQGEDGKTTYRLLITGYSKPKIFANTPENTRRINDLFSRELVNLIDNAPTEAIANNMKKSLTDLKDPMYQLRIMHWFKTNGKLSYDMFAPENFVNGFNMGKVARKAIKYSNLFANELSRPITWSLINETLTKNTGMLPEVREALTRIRDTFDETGIAFIGDEAFSETFTDKNGNIAERNIFNVRKGHVEQILNDPDLPESMRAHLAEKFSNEKHVESLNSSAWDGIIFIDKDTYLANLAFIPDGQGVNALKPTIWHNSGQSTMLGKGMYIYIPEIATRMEQMGIRMLMGGSASKSVRGLARDGKEMTPIDASNIRNTSSLFDVMTDNNIMNISFGEQGLIKTAHSLTNAPISHTVQYGSDRTATKDIRDWMKLQEIIDTTERWSNDMKRSASTNLAEVLAQVEAEGGFQSQQLGFVNDLVTTYNYHHTHPLVQRAIFRMFKDRMLGKISSPMGSRKQGKYYIYPNFDLSLKNPYYLTFGNGTEGVEVITRFGEADLPYEYKYGAGPGKKSLRTVHDLNELKFSIRQDGIDYMVEINDKGELEVFDHLKLYEAENYVLPAGITRTTPKIPQALKDIIDGMRRIMKSEHGYNNLGNGTEFTLGRMAEHFNLAVAAYNTTGRLKTTVPGEYGKKLDSGMLTTIERGPRKGISDFQTVKIRSILKEEMGPVLSINSYDARVGLQADWDGDAVNVFHGVPSSKARNAIFDAGLVPDYPTLPVAKQDQFKLNPFGIDIGNTGKAGVSKTDGLGAYMADTRRGEMAMGKVLGMNNALTWMINSGLKIHDTNGKVIEMNAGLDNASKIKYRKNFAYYAATSQSIVDIAHGLERDLRANPLSKIFFSKGTELFGKPGEAGPIDMAITEIVMNVMRRPANLFNNIQDRAGKHKPRADEINSMYTDLRMFFNAPSEYVLTELLRKMKKDKTPWEKKREIFSRFYDMEKLNLKDEKDFLTKLRKGKLPPMKAVIKFSDKFIEGTKNDIDGLIRLSQPGEILQQLVSKNIFNDRGYVNAWDISGGQSNDVKAYADIVRNAEQKLLIHRLLGDVKEEYNPGDAGALFDGSQFPTDSKIGKIEHMARLETVIHYENQRASSHLRFLRGNKYTNEYLVEAAEDRVLGLQRMEKLLDDHIKRQSLGDNLQKVRERVIIVSSKGGKGTRSSLTGPRQKGKYTYYYKVKNDRISRQDAEGNDVIDYKAIDRNPIILRSGVKMTHDKFGNKLSGKYISLENPMASKRLNAEETKLGYLTYENTKNMDIMSIFPNDGSRAIFEQNLLDTRKQIQNFWDITLEKLKKGGEYADPIFLRTEAQFADIFRQYITENRNKIMDFNDAQMMEMFGVDSQTMGADAISQAQVYYLAKMLIMPKPMVRMAVKLDNGVNTPYYYTNRVVYEQTMKWLRREHPEVFEIIAREQGEIHDYQIGRTETLDITPVKSSIYSGKGTIGIEDVQSFNNNPSSFTRFAFDPGMGLLLKDKGVMTLGKVEQNQNGPSTMEVKQLVENLNVWENKSSTTCK